MLRSRAVVAGQSAARAFVLLLFALPVLAALPLALSEALSAAAWRDLLADPQVPGAAALSVASALASTLIALLMAMALTSAFQGTAAGRRMNQALAPMLALPHAAFAIGLAWLVAPAGAVARLLAPVFGWQSPPAWSTVNDPQALLLTAVLVLKELPFLLWNIAALLARPEVAAELRAQRAVARTLGYTARALWWRVLWPAWLPRLAWPLLAVLAYGVTVVDVALIAGPGSPPTLAVLAYADLVGGNPDRNARGAAAALLLAALLALIVGLTPPLWRAVGALWRRAGTDGVRRPPSTLQRLPARVIVSVLPAVYVAVAAALLILSLAGVWTFPAWWPQVLTLDAWSRVLESGHTVGLTAALALAASLLSLVLTLAWLEATPPRWDARITPLVMAPLVVPSLLLMTGLYQGALHLRLDGTGAGLLWVHVLVVLPYSFITLRPAWRGFEPRFEATALALGRSRVAFWWRIKWPLLAAPMAATLAVGFAVSVAQFLATQFLGAGRIATVTTEAVLLAGAGQRTLAAAFALLQALLPLAAFALAARFGRGSTIR